MPKTVVGLFESPGLVEGVVHGIEALGFPRTEVRSLTEPSDFNVTGVMSFPDLDYEADLIRELTRIGATHGESGAYVEGLRRGGALVFATGSGRTGSGRRRSHEPAGGTAGGRSRWSGT